MRSWPSRRCCWPFGVFTGSFLPSWSNSNGWCTDCSARYLGLWREKRTGRERRPSFLQANSGSQKTDSCCHGADLWCGKGHRNQRDFRPMCSWSSRRSHWPLGVFERSILSRRSHRDGWCNQKSTHHLGMWRKTWNRRGCRASCLQTDSGGEKRDPRCHGQNIWRKKCRWDWTEFRKMRRGSYRWTCGSFEMLKGSLQSSRSHWDGCCTEGCQNHLGMWRKTWNGRWCRASCL